ncbi:5-methylcytosine-specific restriction system specificity protein McrC [Corynebacterium sp. zg254]|uniref:5-methylcytosine-specific restriction system specificity protein McrC n=2 Tax=Corynebacterium zhongnanshanii TaxID=2768834 RepID=A0ABQ6VG49_9CORY|nr:5-methylcytosine-specific restriction system specificity protein McrC [Corynebacterium sp. zg254]KAB3523288.1 5-methylcytosine-specific restriction system specificity protein McrC [Corynebacterium zhongnanshanii]MCR5913591.1 5-methylcytosine-specific restriction system specificity protein McrC [Corynebacterium sp. zg254]
MGSALAFGGRVTTGESVEPRVLRNMYVMLAYAFNAIERAGTSSFHAENCDNLHELCAEILLQGITNQTQRGLHRDYLNLSEELHTVRGRIDFSTTLSTGARGRGAVVCDHDEYVLDTPHNRILASVLQLLFVAGDLSTARRRRVHDALRLFRGVTIVAPRSIRWRDVHYTRMTADYRLMHGVCRLVVEGLLQREGLGEQHLASWFSPEQESALYERFLLRYFQRHHRHLAPSASHIEWDVDEVFSGAEQLPTMRSDVILSGNGKALIIDAKYYGRSMRARFGQPKVDSGHLYQILSYVSNRAAKTSREVMGLLLYAKTNEAVTPALDTSIHGHRIAAKTLDLMAPWDAVRAQLDDVVAWANLTELY